MHREYLEHTVSVIVHASYNFKNCSNFSHFNRFMSSFDSPWHSSGTGINLRSEIKMKSTAQVRAFYPLTSSLSSTSIPPSLSSSICLWIMRRASRLNRSSSVKHGGLRELQGSKRGKTNQNKKKNVSSISLEYDDSKQDIGCEFLYVHTYWLHVTARL